MTTMYTSPPSEDYLQTLVNEDSIDPTLVQKARWKVSFRDVQVHNRGLYDLHEATTNIRTDLNGWDTLGVTPEARTALRTVSFDEDKFAQLFVHPEVIQKTPKLFSYYRALSGFSENKLKRMSTVSSAIRQIQTANTSNQQMLTHTEDLTKLCCLCNAQISLWAVSLPDRIPEINYSVHDYALQTALLTEGASIEGASRNRGGRNAVVNISATLIPALAEQNILKGFEVRRPDDTEYVYISAEEYEKFYTETMLVNSDDFGTIYTTNNGSINLDHSEPDMVISDGSTITGLAEIKNRTDKSNQWESLPIIRSKLEDFKLQHPTAKRMLIQPLYTHRMIHGQRGQHSEDVSIQQLTNTQLLDMPFNTQQILTNQTAKTHFTNYIITLLGYTPANFSTSNTTQQSTSNLIA